MNFDYENKRNSFVEDEIKSIVDLVVKKENGELSDTEEKELDRKLSRYSAYEEEIRNRVSYRQDRTKQEK